eukprot:NODE_99_length_20465_cov_0.827654.p17 type:complete len:178 gc:universal NODE_99_length_20465_cov_0.827654:14748-15281(+)
MIFINAYLPRGNKAVKDSIQILKPFDISALKLEFEAVQQSLARNCWQAYCKSNPQFINSILEQISRFDIDQIANSNEFRNLVTLFTKYFKGQAELKEIIEAKLPDETTHSLVKRERPLIVNLRVLFRITCEILALLCYFNYVGNISEKIALIAWLFTKGDQFLRSKKLSSPKGKRKH